MGGVLSGDSLIVTNVLLPVGAFLIRTATHSLTALRLVGCGWFREQFRLFLQLHKAVEMKGNSLWRSERPTLQLTTRVDLEQELVALLDQRSNISKRIEASPLQSLATSDALLDHNVLREALWVTLGEAWDLAGELLSYSLVASILMRQQADLHSTFL